MLERAGASFGILPCNTLHKHIDDIRASVAIPFLSIIEETQRQLEVLAVRSVGILATQTTISSGLYGTPLQEKGLDLIHPNAAQQKRIGRVIIELVRGESRKIHGELIANICTSLHNNGAEIILLACTDLQLVPDIQSPVPVIDTTEILIEASVRELLRR